jgi:hypothetical protein
MKPWRIFGIVGLVLLASVLSGQDGPQKGVIKKVDADKSTLTLTADGKDLIVKVTAKTKVMDANDMQIADPFKDQRFKPGTPIFFKADGDTLVGIRALGAGGKGPPFVKVDSSKLVPLNELGDKEYKDGYKGGFYPDGKNERPKEHEAAGLRFAKQIQPRNAAGKVDPQGKIVLLSVGMSNTSQASQGFQKVLAAAEGVNPLVVFVNGAVGGQTAYRIQNPDNADGAKYWGIVDQRLKEAGVTRDQVQVIWIKEADAGPNQGFPGYAKKLEEELTRIVQIFPKRFRNAKLVYLSSRTYGGFATTALNPEPYAYESAFSVKWLIERQIKGDSGLNFDAGKGEVRAPWLSWGPYLWANGSKKRADGFSYEPGDFTANDGTHLTASGMDKVGRLMLQFFQNDSTARGWFLAK